MFVRIKSCVGDYHYINPLHIIDIFDVTILAPGVPPHCQMYLTNTNQLATFETAVSIIEKIVTLNEQSKSSASDTK
jgi:hypothetical protein